MNTDTSKRDIRPEDAHAPQAVDTPRLPVTQPAADIFEGSDTFLLVADMPGMDPTGIDVRLEREILHVEGVSATEGLDPIVYKRAFRVIRGLDPANITASYTQGVLTVRVPKPDSMRPRKINVVAG